MNLLRMKIKRRFYKKFRRRESKSISAKEKLILQLKISIKYGLHIFIKKLKELSCLQIFQ